MTKSLRLLRSNINNESKRDIVALATSPGTKRLIVEFTIHISPLEHNRLSLNTTTLSEKQRKQYLSNSEGIEIDSPEVIEVISKLTAEKKEELIGRIFNYVNENIILDNTLPNDDAAIALRNHKANSLGLAKAMVVLCRASKIPSRIVTGFVLRDEFDITEHYWVESYNESKWTPYDPENGY